MLRAIGLDEAQESAYRTLVQLGAAEVSDLALRSTLAEDETVRALRRLERQGLAARSSARPERWVAAPPEVALRALLTRQRQALERAEREAEALATEYRAEGAEPDAHDLVEVVTGADAVAQRFAQLRLGARREVCALIPGADSDPDTETETGEAEEPAEPAVRPGVRHRVVLEQGPPAGPAGMTRWARAAGGPECVRVAEWVPAKVVIADRALAMVPLTDRTAEPSALVVHASGLLDSLLGLFDRVWRQALPIRIGADGTTCEAQPPDGPDATDLEVLSLLLAGLTDASVAKQLDLGLRTVQRRVKRLMELTGVATRLQLGWHVYERGWIARDPH
ncbi:helix-turn-helix domain-containing protein [Streptomyces sp. URMC 123]|uniref:helix-turn-helix domain-containing protein n=1 Tax=Streptomyces sp. URMC 123 TaxID=3423403 RepID=UPI003F1B5671